jgi:hypothetical protein
MISLRAMMIHLEKSYYYMDQIEQFLRHNMVAYLFKNCYVTGIDKVNK